MDTGAKVVAAPKLLTDSYLVGGRKRGADFISQFLVTLGIPGQVEEHCNNWS